MRAITKIQGAARQTLEASDDIKVSIMEGFEVSSQLNEAATYRIMSDQKAKRLEEIKKQVIKNRPNKPVGFKTGGKIDKSKSTCRKCGLVGHWFGDPECPQGKAGDAKTFRPQTPKPADT